MQENASMRLLQTDAGGNWIHQISPSLSELDRQILRDLIHRGKEVLRHAYILQQVVTEPGKEEGEGDAGIKHQMTI